jgi:hypothetical protein
VVWAESRDELWKLIVTDNGMIVYFFPDILLFSLAANEANERILNEKDTILASHSLQNNAIKTVDEVYPCIDELLRTGYYPAKLALRVECIVDVPIRIVPSIPLQDPLSSSGEDSGRDTADRSCPPNRRAFRVFLSDGEVVIQALLSNTLHRYVLAGDITEGGIMILEDFEVKRARRVGRKTGEVIYLAVSRFERPEIKNAKAGNQQEKVNLGNEAATQGKRRRSSEESEGGHKIGPKRVKFDLTEDRHERTASSNSDSDDGDELNDFMSQSTGSTGGKEREPEAEKLEDSFESGTESVSRLRECMDKEDLRQKEQERKKDFSGRVPSNLSTTIAESQREDNEQPQRHKAFFFSQPLRPIERPLNVLSLSELVFPYKPLPKRNYLCDVFAVISRISPTIVKRQHMPPKRDMRILDPSIEQRRPHGLQVSVFADAAGFQPPAGTIALFRSLKTHEWDGISLNAYEKDCLGREWFISDPAKLRGYDVAGMTAWWEQRAKDKGKEKESGSD